MYKLNYQQHNILKQAAFIIMQNHNKQAYQANQKQKFIITTIVTESQQKQTTTSQQKYTTLGQYIKTLQNNTNLEIHSQEQLAPNRIIIKGINIEGNCPSIYIIIETATGQPINKPIQFIKYNQTLQLLYKKTQQELLDIIDKYLEQQEIKHQQELIEQYNKQIIIPKLKQPTQEQLNHMIVKLQELEKQYYLQLDIDYTDEQSIKLAYQQVLYYNYYKIPIPKKETEEILIGNLELLDKGERI